MAFSECLARNASLKVLDLRANYITDEGALALAVAASKSQTLTLLNLHCNDFGPGVGAELERVLASSSNALESLGEEGSSDVLQTICSVQ